jgi:hypothetical protein
VCAATNEYLDGARSDRLNVPAEPPAEQFWSITLYDPATRTLLPTSQSSRTSAASGIQPRTAMDHSTSSSVPTSPTTRAPAGSPPTRAKGWFALFPFYGPPGGYINRTWKLGDLTPI